MNRPQFPIETFQGVFDAWQVDRTHTLKSVLTPTASGKTHASARTMIDMVKKGVTPIYLAPIRKLTEDFPAQLKEAMKEKSEDFPIYRIFARADYLENDTFIEEMRAFAREAQKRFGNAKLIVSKSLFDDSMDIEIDEEAVENEGGEGEGEGEMARSEAVKFSQIAKGIQAAILNYERARSDALYDQLSRDSHRERAQRAFSLAWSRIGSVCKEIVRRSVLSGHQERLYHHPALRPILLKIVPLDLNEETPGVILATTSKFATIAEATFLKESKRDLLGKDTFQKKRASHFEFFADRPAALFLDEEEEGWMYLFKSQKKTLAHKDIDLHRVLYAFFHYYDLGRIPRYARNFDVRFARALFDALDQIVSKKTRVLLIDAIEAPTIDEKRRLLAQIPCFKEFKPEWLEVLMEDLLNKTRLETLLKKLDILRDFKRAASEIFKSFPNAEAPIDAFETLMKLDRLFNENDKKRLLVDVVTLQGVKKDLTHLFFDERLNLTDLEILESLRLIPVHGYDSIELVSAVSLEDIKAKRKMEDSISLGEYLKLIMFATRALRKRGRALPRLSSHELARITSNPLKTLSDYKDRIAKWKLRDKEEEGLPSADHILDEAYVFETPKFEISLIEEDDPPETREYSTGLRQMMITASTLTTTPEDLLFKFLGKDTRTGNLVYLMSATGGLTGCWGRMNLHYLKNKLASTGGRYIGLVDEERGFIEAFRAFQAHHRNTVVEHFNEHDYMQKVKVAPRFKVLRDHLSSYLVEHHRNNIYKERELNYFASLIWRLVGSEERSAMCFTQTISNIKNALEGLYQSGMGVERPEGKEGLFTFDPKVFGFDGEPIKIMTYTASFMKGNALALENDELVLVEDVKAEQKILAELGDLLREDRTKFIFVTGFASAGRGLTLTPRCAIGHGKEQKNALGEIINVKDFDVLMIAMSPFYDSLYRVPDRNKIHLEELQAGLQYLYEVDRLKTTTLRDLPAIIESERDEMFRPEYFRYIWALATQTIGRVERIPTSTRHQSILINQELLLELIRFYQMESQTIDGTPVHERLSHGNRAVYEHAQAYIKTNRYLEEDEFQRYVVREVKLTDRFNKASKRIYTSFALEGSRNAWQAIRNDLMLTDQAAYLRHLEQTPEGINEDVWKNFTSTLFMEDAFSEWRTIDAKTLLRGVPAHIAGKEEIERLMNMSAGMKLYTDMLHVKGSFATADAFKPAERLAPAELRRCPDFERLVSSAGLVPAKLLQQHFPRYAFFMDYVKPYFSERIVETYLESLDIRFVDPAQHPATGRLFEKFDLFVDAGSRILAIDVKTWGKTSDGSLGEKIIQAVERKTREVTQAFNETLSPENGDGDRIRSVIPVYLNLYGDRDHAKIAVDGMDVHFFNLFVRNLNEEGHRICTLNPLVADYFAKFSGAKND